MVGCHMLSVIDDFGEWNPLLRRPDMGPRCEMNRPIGRMLKDHQNHWRQTMDSVH
jgi:hypothetical protein